MDVIAVKMAMLVSTQDVTHQKELEIKLEAAKVNLLRPDSRRLTLSYRPSFSNHVIEQKASLIICWTTSCRAECRKWAS
ncbi:hypothetical protein WJX84_011266 [Apatococcus fuscideae]|uniref:Uncharacterized protein n=1 Tax=Apatococcus fuscideae TaxID=2026836 RepID=A0AAW1SNS9_9CHLO